MTDEQAAKVPSLRTQLLAAAHEFSVYLPEPLEPGDCDELMHILEPVVTSLLAARERAVWAEVDALLLETHGYSVCCLHTLKHVLGKCRAQAKKAQP